MSFGAKPSTNSPFATITATGGALADEELALFK